MEQERQALDPRALPVAARVGTHLRAALGRHLVAAYVHGSAVLGGYDPAVSDLDVLAVCAEVLTDSQIDAICAGVGDLPLPAKGLEMSVLTRSEAAHPDQLRPRYQVHLAVAADGTIRRVDGRRGPGDRDLVLHAAVCRDAGYALFGPPASSVLAPVAPAAVRQAIADEIDWASTEAPVSYLVLTAARGLAFERTGKLVSKVEAAEAALAMPDTPDVVAAALTEQRGGSAEIDHVAARLYATRIAARLRDRA